MRRSPKTSPKNRAARARITPNSIKRPTARQPERKHDSRPGETRRRKYRRAVASPRFFAAPPRSTSSTTYCGVLPPSWLSLSLVARKMFSRDTPRQPEKRSRFLVGQCQPIFPSTTIFLALLLLLLRFFANRQINATNGAVIFSVFLSSYSPSTRPVPLFHSTARTCRCK